MRDLIKWFLPLFAVALMASSCGSYKKMISDVDQIGFTTTPEVLTLVGGKVAVDLSVNFPPHYFEKSAVLQVTPVLNYADGEIVFEPILVQGSSVTFNNRSVNFAKGGVVTETLVFDYKPSMRRSTLSVRVAICDGKQFVLVNPKTGTVIPSGEMKLIVDEPKSEESAKVLADCEIAVAPGVCTLVHLIDYKRLFIEVDNKMVEEFANQTIFEKGYTASLITAEECNTARELNNEGVKLANSGKIKEAVAKFEAAKAMGVYVDASNSNLFFSYLLMGDKEAAKSVYDITCSRQRAAVHIINREYDEAKKLIKDGQTLAVLSLIDGDCDNALKVLKKDNSPRANYIRAIAYARKGQIDEAKKSLNAAIKVKMLKELSEKEVYLIAIVK